MAKDLRLSLMQNELLLLITTCIETLFLNQVTFPSTRDYTFDISMGGDKIQTTTDAKRRKRF